jgi:hypothetical protein
MKKNLKKLSLNRETLRTLDIVGGAVAITTPQPAPQPVTFTTSQTISICKYCTTPLDGCQTVTQTIA